MKKLLIVIILGVLILPTSGQSSETTKRTVIDYFNLRTDAGEKKIVQKNGAWQIEGLGGPITLTVVDIPNGYLAFDDPGTGGGLSTVTAALFLAGNGEPMLAVHEVARTTGTCPDPTYTLKIFHMEMDRMDQSRKVLPDLSLGLFLKKGYDPQKRAPRVVAAGLYRIGYRLPRKGTTVEAFLDASNLECGLAVSGDGMPKQEIEETKDFLQNVRKEPVKLKWNKATGVFEADAGR